jgi:hypothetical protein
MQPTETQAQPDHKDLLGRRELPELPDLKVYQELLALLVL